MQGKEINAFTVNQVRTVRKGTGTALDFDLVVAAN